MAQLAVLPLSALIRAYSSHVGPSSRSASRSHDRSVSAWQPTAAATERIVAARVVCLLSCSHSSAANAFELVVLLVSEFTFQKSGPPGNPGMVHPWS